MSIKLQTMRSLGQNLEKLMKTKGFNQTSLALASGVTQATIWKILKGQTKNPRHLPFLAKALGVAVEDLLEEEPEHDSEASYRHVTGYRTSEGVGKAEQKDRGMPSLTIQIKQIPLISWVAAGHWTEVSENFLPGDGEEIIPCPTKCGPDSFALRVKGDSMSPDYLDGSVIVVDPGREPRHDADVVVRLNSDMEATFKRLKIDGSRWYLHPLNDRYPVISLEGKDFTICGTVIWVGREVK